MDAWFPKFSTQGKIVSGSGSVWLCDNYQFFNPRQISEKGWSAGFLDNNRIIYNNDESTTIYDIRTNKNEIINEHYNIIVAGGGKYIGLENPNLKFGDYKAEGKSPSISKSGKNVAWLEPYFPDVTNIVFNKAKLFEDKNYQVVVSDQALIYVADRNRDRETFGMLLSDGINRELTVRNWEEVLLCDTPNGPWIISIFQDGIGVRPFLSMTGQFFPDKNFLPSDALFINNKIIVVGSSFTGEGRYLEIDPSILNVNLNSLDNVIIDKDDKDMVRMSPNKRSLVERLAREHPEINLADEVARGRLVDYVAIEANREDNPAADVWGRKARKADGSNKNTDGLTYLRPDGNFEIIDIITGSGKPTWIFQGIFKPGENGYWAPADSVSDSPNPPEEPNNDDESGNESNSLEKRILMLELEMMNLRNNTLKSGDIISLKTEKGLFICAEASGIDENEVDGIVRFGGNVNATRRAVGNWEKFKVEKI